MKSQPPLLRVTLWLDCQNYFFSMPMQGATQLISLTLFKQRPKNIPTQQNSRLGELPLCNHTLQSSNFSQEPFQRRFDWGSHSDDFHIAITDSGLCQVLNGNTMRSTFTPTYRIKEMSGSFDTRNVVNPLNISGSGKSNQITLWLDIGDRLGLV